MAFTIGSLAPERSLEARRHVEEALRLDPASAESWALLANLLVSDYLNHWNGATLRDVDLAEDALQRALAIDQSSWMAHFAAGFIRSVRGDHDAALREFEETITLNPSWAGAYAQKANELVFLGRAREAPDLGKRAVNLSPRDPSIGVFYWVIGRAYFIEGDYQNAIHWLKQSVEESPNLWFNRAWLISAYALAGLNKEAKATLSDFMQAFPSYTLSRIIDIYSNEDRFRNPTIQASAPHLYEGFRQAGAEGGDGKTAETDVGTLEIRLAEDISASQLEAFLSVTNQLYLDALWLQRAQDATEGVIPDEYTPSESEKLWINRLEIGTPNWMELLGHFGALGTLQGYFAILAATTIAGVKAYGDLQLKLAKAHLLRVEAKLKDRISPEAYRRIKNGVPIEKLQAMDGVVAPQPPPKVSRARRPKKS